jgi:membrane protein involved in colicin uptake
MGLFDGFKKAAEEAKAKAELKVETAKKDVATLAKEVASGKWGTTEAEIKQKLKEAGITNYDEIKQTADKAKAAAEEAKKKAEQAAADAKAKAEAAKAAAEREAAKAAARVENITKLANEVIQGKWGNGQERVDKLTAAGYDYKEVQGKVNEILHGGNKDLEAVAKEVIQGKWGNGQERVDKLTAAGYDYKEVQSLVNKLLA